MKNRALALAFIIILLFSFSHAISTENSWETKPPMHFSRTGAVAADVNGIVYVIGGSQKYNTSDTGFSYIYINSTEAYEPATDTWVDKAPMPTPREGLGAAVFEEKIYCFGGKNVTARASRALIIAVVNDTLYVIGGGHNIFTRDSIIVMQYTPFTNPPVEMDAFSEKAIAIVLMVIGAGLGLSVYLIKRNKG